MANLEKTLNAQRIDIATPAHLLSPPVARLPVRDVSGFRLSLPDFGPLVPQGRSNLLEELLKPEYTYEGIPYELLKEARKRKKGRRR